MCRLPIDPQPETRMPRSVIFSDVLQDWSGEIVSYHLPRGRQNILNALIGHRVEHGQDQQALGLR